MKLSPWILGAVALVPIAGAAIGSHMSTDPVGVHQDVLASLPITPQIAHASTTAKARPRLPDHYAMETPEGVVEVHELAMRGRLKDRYGFGQRYEDEYDYSYEADLSAQESLWESDRPEDRAERALSDSDPHTPSTANRPTSSAQPAERYYSVMQEARTGEDIQTGVATIGGGVIEVEVAEPRNGNARTINVAGEIASLY
ncbi:MAG: hypothetical protein WA957_13250 [Alteraurantiacibacter sp.]